MILRTPEDFREYERNNKYISHNNIHICSVSEEGAEIRLDIRPESCNVTGPVHGGMLMTLVDVAAGQAALANGGNYVTQNCCVNFTSNVQGGTLFARSNVIKRGKKTALVHVQIHTDEGKLLVDATATLVRLD